VIIIIIAGSLNETLPICANNSVSTLVLLLISVLWMSSLTKTNLTVLEQFIKETDTSAASARQGKDIQGIQWDRLNITREKYRLTRLEQYRNYENVPLSGEAVEKVSYLP